MKTLETPIYYNPDLTQIINGEEVMSPSPKMPHQRASSRLLRTLMNFVGDNQLGEIYHAPFDVIFEEDFNHLQPDIFFVSVQNQNIVVDWVRGVPDLVIEIVSPGSKKVDTLIKKQIYERYGVNECWIVFPENLRIEVYTLADNHYVLYGSFSDHELVRSRVFERLSFPANVIAP
ncbi:MAG: restriction endonuclease [Dyadobacter sp. 50-39]|uniref:Uma2 family endonuclease n=1 Tax=Dyadobacter sp. 50-39 TaxID=1895756 RepID=UPI000962D653|nr:Uma2 family endonuclease [Dyadobacter sp. 50-39]OJV16514.1 MAG: restriction endonuclease [Dyadobacter sp. 50-39]